MPAHWRLVRLRHVVALRPSPAEVAGLAADTPVTFLPMEAIGDGGSYDPTDVRPLSDVASGYSYFRDGDVLRAKVTPCFENGKGALVDKLRNGVGFGTTELFVMRPGPTMHGQFLYYLTMGTPFTRLGEATIYGAHGVKRVDDGFVRNFAFGLPPGGEQRDIAAFLDRETALIDEVARKKYRLLGAVDQRLGSLVSELVARGTDTPRCLRHSGVPGLGLLPAGWRTVRLKFLADVLGGVTKGRDLGGRATVELPYLRVANVQAGYLDLRDIATIEILPEEVGRYSLQAGDVLMNEGGDIDKLGRGTVWDGCIDPCLHQNHVFALRPHPGVDAAWLATITLTSYARQYFETRGKQTTNLASISAGNVRELPIVVPPADQQQAILEAVERETRSITRVVAAVQTDLRLLSERRQALITAAVTGQIDVSGIPSEHVAEPLPAGS